METSQADGGGRVTAAFSEEEAKGDRAGSRGNSSEGVKPQNLSLGSRHIPLVPEFDVSHGVRALGPKSPWKNTSFF